MVEWAASSLVWETGVLPDIAPVKILNEFVIMETSVSQCGMVGVFAEEF